GLGADAEISDQIVVSIGAEHEEYAVGCRSVAFYPNGSSWQGPSYEFRDWSLHLQPAMHLHQATDLLRELSGSALQWWKLSPSHGYVGLLVTGLPRGPLE